MASLYGRLDPDDRRHSGLRLTQAMAPDPRSPIPGPDLLWPLSHPCPRTADDIRRALGELAAFGLRDRRIRSPVCRDGDRCWMGDDQAGRRADAPLAEADADPRHRAARAAGRARAGGAPPRRLQDRRAVGLTAGLDLADDLADQIERPRLRLDERAADILAHDRQHEDLGARHEHDDHDQAGPTGNSGQEQPGYERIHHANPGEAEKYDPRVDSQAKRLARKGGDRIQREIHHLAEAVMRFPCKARLTVILDRYLPEADPAHHAPYEAMRLGHAEQRFQDATIDQAKVARIGGNVEIDQPVKQAIEDHRSQLLRPRFSGARPALAINDLGALIHDLHHRMQQLRRILQISIENQDARSRAGLQTSG